MTQEFDPYLKWLGISKREPRPINYYRLLGVDKFETDPDVIAMNGDKQIEHLRKFSAGEHGDFAEKLINDLIKAKLTLLKPERKAVYDEQLHAASQPAEQAVALPQQSVAPAVKPPLANAYVAPAPFVAPMPAPMSSAPVMSDPANWNIGVTAAPAAATAAESLPANQVPAISVGNFSPYGESPVRSAASPARAVIKPRNTLIPWVILAVSVLICVGLTMMLANRNSEAEPIAKTDPAAANKNPEEKTPNAPAVNTPEEAPPKQIEPPLVAAVPEKKPPQPEPNPRQPNPPQPQPVPANNKLAWPPIADPNEVQTLAVVDAKNLEMTLYRYPGKNARMATIISRGHTASRWSIEKDELVLTSGVSSGEYLLFGDHNWKDYTLEYEIYYDSQSSQPGIGLIFRSEDDSRLPIFQNGRNDAITSLETWSVADNSFKGFSHNSSGNIIRNVNEIKALKRVWRPYSITVIGNNKVIARRDGATIFNTETKLPGQGRVGLGLRPKEDTMLRVRNIRVTAPDGNLLWSGLPELPPSLATAPPPQEIVNRFPGPQQNPQDVNRRATDDLIAKNIPAANPLNPPNPKPAAANQELATLAEKDDDVKKFVEELAEARETYDTNTKKFEETYLKAFDLEMTRVRTTVTLKPSERLDLLEVVAKDKKDFETNKRFSISHGMLPQNKVIALMLIEQQRYERVYTQMIERMNKANRDDVVAALKSAMLNDPKLRPFKVFSVRYQHSPGGPSVNYTFLADKTVSGKPKVTWFIDAEKRLNIAGPLQGSQETQEQLKITQDGRRLIEGKSSTTKSVKSGTIIVD